MRGAFLHAHEVSDRREITGKIRRDDPRHGTEFTVDNRRFAQPTFEIRDLAETGGGDRAVVICDDRQWTDGRAQRGAVHMSSQRCVAA